MLSPILEALFATVSENLDDLHCLDLTPEKLAESWLAGRLDPKLKPIDGRYDLVICNADQIETACDQSSQDGILLVHTSRIRPLDQKAVELKLTRQARVRDGQFEWLLFSRDPTPCETGYSLSLVVAVQDSAAELNRLVTLLAADDSQIPWELIIVDRGSFDETAALSRCLEGDFQYIVEDRERPHFQALHVGLMRASAPISIVVHPRLVPESNWLRQVAHATLGPQNHGLYVGMIDDPYQLRSSPTQGRVPLRTDLFAVRNKAYKSCAESTGFDDTQAILLALADSMGEPVFVPGLRATQLPLPSPQRTGS